MLKRIKDLFTPNPPQHLFVDDEKIERRAGDGVMESIRWDEVEHIEIITTDEGPWVDDVYWVLAGGQRGCAIPGSLEGTSELLARMQSLPGFDNMKVIEAMGSTDNARFVCWRRS